MEVLILIMMGCFSFSGIMFVIYGIIKLFEKPKTLEQIQREEMEKEKRQQEFVKRYVEIIVEASLKKWHERSGSGR